MAEIFVSSNGEELFASFLKFSTVLYVKWCSLAFRTIAWTAFPVLFLRWLFLSLGMISVLTKRLFRFFSQVQISCYCLQNIVSSSLAVDRIFRLKASQYSSSFFWQCISSLRWICAFWDPKQLPVQCRNAHRLIEYYKPVCFPLL